MGNLDVASADLRLVEAKVIGYSVFGLPLPRTRAITKFGAKFF